MKLSPAQRSAMLPLWMATGWVSQYDIEVHVRTMDCLIQKGMIRFKVDGSAFYRLTPTGRDWCKNNFTDVLTTMIEDKQ